MASALDSRQHRISSPSIRLVHLELDVVRLSNHIICEQAMIGVAHFLIIFAFVWLVAIAAAEVGRRL